MLTLAKIEQREQEILQARQALVNRIVQMDGALEAIAIFKADHAAAVDEAEASAEALKAEQAAERAVLEGEAAEGCDWARCRDARCGNGCVKLEAVPGTTNRDAGAELLRDQGAQVWVGCSIPGCSSICQRYGCQAPNLTAQS